MAQPAAVIPGDWLIFRRPDKGQVLIAAEEIDSVWSGEKPGTLVIERKCKDEPVLICYSSLADFALHFMDFFDESKQKAPGVTPGPNRVLKLTASCETSATLGPQTKTK